MKKLIVILLAGALLLSFAACKKDPEPTTAPGTTTAAATQTPSETTAVPTTQESTTEAESTTAKGGDITFIYDGYWYMTDGNKVFAFAFGKEGSVEQNIYRRKSLSDSASAPDSVFYGTYIDNKNGDMTVYPNDEYRDEFYTFVYDGAAEKLTCVFDDPEGKREVTLQHFGTLSAENAVIALTGDN